MKRDMETRLDRATHALRADLPAEAAIAAAAARSAQALGIEMNSGAWEGAIHNCEGMQRLFTAYRAGTLPQSRRILVEAHLRDCGLCLRAFEGRSDATLNWSAPPIARAPR